MGSFLLNPASPPVSRSENVAGRIQTSCARDPDDVVAMQGTRTSRGRPCHPQSVDSMSGRNLSRGSKRPRPSRHPGIQSASISHRMDVEVFAPPLGATACAGDVPRPGTSAQRSTAFGRNSRRACMRLPRGKLCPYAQCGLQDNGIRPGREINTILIVITPMTDQCRR